MRAIIVDHDPIARAMLLEVLTSAGHQATALSDSLQAAALLEGADVPDLILADWRARGLDGAEICRRARGLAPKAPHVILLAAPDEPEAIAAAEAAGADDLLIKPLRMDMLRLRMRVAARSQAAHAELAALRQAAALRTRQDPLTQVLDRQSISQRLDEELARAVRAETPLAGLLVDIDRFRDINEAFGHAAGDTVLATVAARVRRILRRYDAMGRWDAEEFLVVLPGCTAVAARGLADRLLAAIRSEPVRTAQGHVVITCSIGGLGLRAADCAADAAELTDALERGVAVAAASGGDRCQIYDLSEEG